MNSSKGIVFLFLLSLACIGDDSAIRLKDIAETNSASLLNIGDAAWLGFWFFNSFGGVTASNGAEERKMGSREALWRL